MLSFTKMRFMDRYLGSALCGCFSFVNQLGRRKQPSQEQPSQVQKILVMKYFGMGSLILSSPMVRAVKQTYPNARIDLLTIEQNRALSDILPIFDRVYAIDTRSLLSVVRSMFLVLRLIRREKYDVIIDAEFFSRFSGLVSYLARPRYSVGFYLPEIWRGNFLTHPVHFNYYRHAIVTFMALAKRLGVESSNYALEPLVISNKVESKVQDKLEAIGVMPGRRLVCINVNTGPLSPERRWPEASFAKLIRSVLSEFPDVTIFLVGAPSDVPAVTKMCSVLSSEDQARLLNVAGKFNLEELCVLLTKSELLITNDSGPLHIAEALAVPTISFFGPETPLLYGPTGDNHVVFYKGIYCSPCLNVHNQKKAPCNGNNVCMQLISPDDVFASTKMLLQGKQVSSPFRVTFDVSAKQLLTDYHSLESLSSLASETVPVALLPEQAGE
jgi:lipopolysaccharide heptosyltransferase II